MNKTNVNSKGQIVSPKDIREILNIKEAWDSIDRGEYTEMEGSQLLKEMKKW